MLLPAGRCETVRLFSLHMRAHWCTDGGAAGGGRRHSLAAPGPERRGADAADGGARKLYPRRQLAFAGYR